MSLSVAPLIIALVAAGLLLFLIGIVPATRQSVERFRLKRQGRKEVDATTSEAWIYQPGAADEQPVEVFDLTAEADVGVGGPSLDQGSSAAIQGPPRRIDSADELILDAVRRSEDLGRESEAEAERITEDARRQARELLEQAELEAKRTVVVAGQALARRENQLDEERSNFERRTRLDSVSAVQGAARRAEELLAEAEQQRTSLVREAEAEAERRAAEITAYASQRAHELLEAAELEAKEIVVDTGQERARLLSDLERERALLEETRTKLGSLDAIEEATRKAEELFFAAEQRREEHRHRSEAKAERKAADITDHARRRANELLEEAKVEAERIIAVAGQERARLVAKLADERSILEETRTRLSGFLTDVLDEVGAASTTVEEPANVRDLDEARSVRTSARADR